MEKDRDKIYREMKEKFGLVPSEFFEIAKDFFISQTFAGAFSFIVIGATQIT